MGDLAGLTSSPRLLDSELRLADLGGVGHFADEVEGETGADVAGDVGHVEGGDDLDDVVADDLPLAGDAAQHVRGLVVGDAAEARGEDAGGDRYVKGVGVEGDVVAI